MTFLDLWEGKLTWPDEMPPEKYVQWEVTVVGL